MPENMDSGHEAFLSTSNRFPNAFRRVILLTVVTFSNSILTMHINLMGAVQPNPRTKAMDNTNSLLMLSLLSSLYFHCRHNISVSKDS